jgi:hypothetical protein
MHALYSLESLKKSAIERFRLDDNIKINLKKKFRWVEVASIHLSLNSDRCWAMLTRCQSFTFHKRKGNFSVSELLHNILTFQEEPFS